MTFTPPVQDGAQTSLGVSSAAVSQSLVATTVGPVVTVGPQTTAAQLQQLINTAAAGTTIKLAAGDYNFSSTITIARDDVSVVGPDQPQP